MPKNETIRTRTTNLLVPAEILLEKEISGGWTIYAKFGKSDQTKFQIGYVTEEDDDAFDGRLEAREYVAWVGQDIVACEIQINGERTEFEILEYIIHEVMMDLQRSLTFEAAHMAERIQDEELS